MNNKPNMEKGIKMYTRESKEKPYLETCRIQFEMAKIIIYFIHIFFGLSSQLAKVIF